MRINNIRVNMILSSIKGILTVVFPFITFPYISRILDVEKLGNYNFSNSIISYFLLLAGLGISTYAMREGSKIRDNYDKLQKLSSELYTLNMISTIISYFLLFLLVLLIPKINDYGITIFLLSSTIILQTVGKEWICIIFEDYFFITIRSLIINIISILLLFIFVKTKNDFYIYVFISVISSSANNILNHFYSKKYCKVKFTLSKNILKHIKPVLIFFSTTLAVSIYVNSDITILGYLKGDYEVGLYSVSVKIYSILKTIIVSMVSVIIPRLSYLRNQGKDMSDEYNLITNEVFSFIITIVLPIIFGSIMLSSEIVFIIAGENYSDGTLSLCILSFALIFCIIGYFWGNCILYSYDKENIVLFTVCLSAIINIILNLILIPKWGLNAAAITTVISEFLSAIILMFYGHKYLKLKGQFIQIIKVLIGCLFIIITILILRKINLSFMTFLIFSTVCSCIVYFLVELILKNNVIINSLNLFLKIIKNMFNNNSILK